jgi:YVTN family beta-propeller protein
MTSVKQVRDAKYKYLLLLLFLTIFININAVIIYVVNSESRTLSRIDTDTNQVQNTFATLGIVPNKVVSTQDALWCVNSGDNAVQKINLNTGNTITNVLIEAGCNPWDACYNNGFLYVTGLFTNKVYKVNTQTNSVVSSVTVGIAPEALCTYGGKLYVTNTGGYQNNYANSSVSVIDLASFEVTNTIAVSANPQYIVEKDGMLHVSCTGNWIDTFGKVCLINPVTETVEQTLNIGGSLNTIWVKDHAQAFAADGNGINLYQYNPDDYSILHDPSNPLTPGGSVVWGNADLIALLAPNWGSNGKVRILHPDLSAWKEYTVGLAPTDMKFQITETPIQDDTHLTKPVVNVYPNPAYQGQDITFKFESKIIGSLKLYNAKGQLVAMKQLNSNQATISGNDFLSTFSNGIHFYKIETGNKNLVGKILILK